MTHRPDILDQIPRDRPAVIEASAGTGKTYTIESLVVDLLLTSDAEIENILVLTFAEKAALELRRRIRSKLAKVLADDESGDGGDAGWPLDETSRRKLVRSLADFDLASISTIHAFFQSILVDHALDVGLLFDQQIADGHPIFSQAFRDLLRRDWANDPGTGNFLLAWRRDLHKSFDDLETFLYDCQFKRSVILPAYDGSRFQQLLSTAPDLTDAAVAEIKSQAKAAKIHGATVNAAITRLRKVAELLVDGASAPEILANLDRLLDNKKTRSSFVKLGQVSGTPTADWVGEFVRSIVPLDAALVRTLLPPTQGEFELAKRSQGVFDFDDMIRLVHRAIEGPHGPSLVNGMRERFRFALIDEFQDTDEMQWDIFKRIFVESGGENPIYLIGDPKQAIFGFRGADVWTYLQAREEVAHETNRRREIELSRSFRSTAAMIETHNAFFAEGFFSGEIRYKTPVACGRPDYRLVSANQADASPVVVWDLQGTMSDVTASQVKDAFGHAIAAEIERLLGSDPAPLRIGDERTARPVEPKDIFVLTATNRDAQQIGAYLRERAIPFSFFKQDGLFQTREARDVLDLLRAITDPSDGSAARKAWNTPFFDVPLADLQQCLHMPSDAPLSRMLLDWHRLAESRRFDDLFSDILNRSGIVRRELVRSDSERELTNYLHLFEILFEESRRTAAGVEGLAESLARFIEKEELPATEESGVQRLESERDAVQVMTMHRSKGLEAAVVFLYGGLSGSLATGAAQYHDESGQRILDFSKSEDSTARHQAERQQEHERLCYVAMTRAKARLYLPFFEPPEKKDHYYRGIYRPIYDRLAQVRDQIPGMRWTAITSNAEPAAFPSDAEPSRTAWPVLLGGSTPVGSGQEAERYVARKRERAPRTVTSYTRLSRELEDAEASEKTDFVDRETRPAIVRREDDLPGGTHTGVFLHAILEDLPFETVDKTTSLDAWRDLPEVRRLVTRCCQSYGIDERHRPTAEALVHAAVASPIDLGEQGQLPGIHAAKRTRREMEFVYPFPEDHHPEFWKDRPEELSIEKGYIRGFVDLLFEYDGRLYFVDWKSNLLPDYEAATIDAEVEASYRLQAMIYCLALMMLLEIRSPEEYDQRFGGLLYVFLRGVKPKGRGSEGVYFRRPDWEEIRSYEAALKRLGAQVGGTLS
ncbi:RecBCD enzyme subunit RecB [Planctomycetes bacterium Pan216]|uniref:DNA 3'-5' helicase n=1 Tax=Kolteria novifilia TaxID=2527975 RepID=A0A518B0S6_9BACT|nr:RecBCD enzyme subunit RecB [Planctomycetes bacterium Pan216]